MASALRSAAVAGRAVRKGVSPGAAPTQPMRHHVHGGRALNVSQMGRYGRHRLDHHNWGVDVLMEKLGDTSKNLAIRDLLRESTESLILERKKKIGANNIEKMWMVGGISIVGYLFGTAVGTLYAKFERRKLLEIKEALGLSKTA